jgi:putative endonuclease
MNSNQKLGNEGESAALQYLIAHNYKILEQNWRFKQKEIDIIAISENELVIIEVKTRQNDFFGEAWEFVSKGKQSFLVVAANAYSDQVEWMGSIRFDIIGICLQPYQLDHLKEAFYPGL